MKPGAQHATLHSAKHGDGEATAPAKILPRPGFSLRAKLLALSLLLVLVPGGLAVALAVHNATAALEQMVGRDLGTVASGISHDLELALEKERERVLMWAQSDLMRDLIVGDVDKRISAFFQSVQAQNPAYLSLEATDEDGVVVAAAAPGRLGMNVRSEDWFRRIHPGRVSVAGPKQVDGGRTAIELSAPIEDPEAPGTPIGVLRVHYDWREMSHQILDMQAMVRRLGLAVGVVVVDSVGRVIGGSWAHARPLAVGENLRKVGWQIGGTPSNKPIGYGFEPAADSFVGFTRSEATGWTTLVLQPRASALAPVTQLRAGLIAVLAVLLALAATIALFLSRRMTTPLRDLTAAAQEIAETGSTSRALEPTSRDEIGELSRTFARMARDLRRAQEDLVAAAKLAFVGEIAAGITHEIRTPLGVMRASAQMLGRALDSTETRARELTEMIIEEVDRLDALVGSLTELSRPRPPERENVDLGPLLERAVEFVDTTSGARSARIHLSVDRNTVAYCDQDQIYQVALNLIVNARQAMPGGGHIHVSTLRDGEGHVGFTVRDDGPGIDPETLQKIFNPFFTTREGGTGLGLAVVKRILEAHHGSVVADSTPGAGTTFTVLLPAGSSST